MGQDPHGRGDQVVATGFRRPEHSVTLFTEVSQRSRCHPCVSDPTGRGQSGTGRAAAILLTALFSRVMGIAFETG